MATRLRRIQRNRRRGDAVLFPLIGDKGSSSFSPPRLGVTPPPHQHGLHVTRVLHDRTPRRPRLGADLRAREPPVFEKLYQERARLDRDAQVARVNGRSTYRETCAQSSRDDGQEIEFAGKTVRSLRPDYKHKTKSGSIDGRNRRRNICSKVIHLARKG